MDNENREGQPLIHQVTPEELQQVTPDELQKTQVLNLQEVEEVVKTEKKFSKKPIIAIAIVGFAFLILGSSFQVLSLLNTKESEEKMVEKRKVVPEVKKEELNCIKTTINNPNGTDVVYTIKYEFNNNKLNSYLKNYAVTQTSGNDSGKQTVVDEAKKYQQYLNSIDGYVVSISTSENGYVLINQVDFSILDLTKIDNKQKENPITTVEYNKNTNKETVRSNAIKNGFTCN